MTCTEDGQSDLNPYLLQVVVCIIYVAVFPAVLERGNCAEIAVNNVISVNIFTVVTRVGINGTCQGTTRSMHDNYLDVVATVKHGTKWK